MDGLVGYLLVDTKTIATLALVLVGIRWHFMYTGGTLLLNEAYTLAEKSGPPRFDPPSAPSFRGCPSGRR